MPLIYANATASIGSFPTTFNSESWATISRAFNTVNSNFNYMSNGAAFTPKTILTVNSRPIDTTAGDINIVLSDIFDSTSNTYVRNTFATNAYVSSLTVGLATNNYVNQSLTLVNNKITGANAAIVTANTGMKSYVDFRVNNVATYGNARVEEFLPHSPTIMAIVTDVSQNTSDIVTANTGMKSYVDSKTTALTSNAGVQQASINSLISNVGSLQSGAVATNVAVTTSNVGMKSYVDTQILVTNQAIVANAQAQQTQIGALESTIVGINTSIVTANTDMKAYVDSRDTAVTTAWTANAANQGQQIIGANAAIVLQGQILVARISSTDANVVAANAAIVTANTNMKSYVDSGTTALTANAGSQAAQIIDLRANVTAANSAIRVIDANLGAYQSYGNLTFSTVANAAQQANQITAANAAIVTANTGMKSYVDFRVVSSTYGSANVQAYLGAFDSNLVPDSNATRSLGSSANQWKDLYVGNVNTSGNIDTSGNITGANIVANANVQAGNIQTTGAVSAAGIITTSSDINALGNVSAGNINTLGNVSAGNIIVGNVSVGDTITTDTIIIGPAHDQGQQFINTGLLMFGNTAGEVDPLKKYYQINIQNVDPDGSSLINLIPDDGSNLENYVAMGVNGSTHFNPAVPGSLPHDAFIYAEGGNLLIGANTYSIFFGTGNHAWSFTDDGKFRLPTNNPQIVYANGVNILSDITSGAYGNANVSAYLSTFSGNISAGNITVQSNGFVQYPVYTDAELQAIYGQLGWVAVVSNSTPSGKLAYWDGTNNRWSYVSDDTAV
jgi:hypothetical protein